MRRSIIVVLGILVFSSSVFAAMKDFSSFSANEWEQVSNHTESNLPNISGILNLNAQYIVFKEDLNYSTPSEALKNGGNIVVNLDSKLWGTFTNSVNLISGGNNSLKCWNNPKTNIVLDFQVWSKVTSQYWWEYDVTGYYCPFSWIDLIDSTKSTGGTLHINFSSVNLGNISSENIAITTGVKPTAQKSLTYDGVGMYTKNTGKEDNFSANVRYLKTTITKFDTKTSINKNIERLTRWKTPDGESIIIFDKDIKYYTKDVSIWNNLMNDLVEISGKKTLIIVWGDLTIKGDMKYQNNTTDLLVVVVKKDKDGNWWNIYIDGNITNIVGTLIADKKITHLSWTTKNKQLYLYGSVFSDSSIEELAKLREFTVMPSKYLESGDCQSLADSLIPTVGNSTEWLKNARAGKRNCTTVDSVQNGLQWTMKDNSFVIEYNPTMKTSDMSILRAAQ